MNRLSAGAFGTSVVGAVLVTDPTDDDLDDDLDDEGEGTTRLVVDGEALDDTTLVADDVTTRTDDTTDELGAAELDPDELPELSLHPPTTTITSAAPTNLAHFQ